MKFSNTFRYPHRNGRIYLGTSPILRRSIGIKTERHAIGIAGAGAGKGSCIIIPQLKRWPHNAVIVDPKGEAAQETWRDREELGQTVRILDPFKVANIPDRLRVSFNPLGTIQPNGFTSREDLKVIADGMVKRADPKHAQWDDGAVNLLSGLMAYTVATAPDEYKNLQTMRQRILLQSRDELYKDAQRMLKCEACGGLAVAAGTTIMSAIENQKGMEVDFLNAAQRHTEWVDSEAMGPTLNSSSFDLNEIKNGRTTLYLVLPPNYIETHAAFLRLFVRCTLDTMGKMQGDQNLRDRQCLFLLDEFYSLGKMETISKAAGLMRGWGVQLFPVLQDIGQLQSLYGREGAETFFGNSDAQIFFGNTDQATLEYISNAIGMRMKSGLFQTDAEHVGKPFMSPREIRAHIAKRQKDIVARRMIVFAQGSDILSVRPKPFFR